MKSAKQPTFLGATGSLWLGALTLLTLIAGLGVWSVSTTISGAIVASGKIEVEQNRQIVQHPDGGVVAEIMVGEGDVVKAGDVLLRLDGSLLRSELSIVEGQLTEVQARRARLEAERRRLRPARRGGHRRSRHAGAALVGRLAGSQDRRPDGACRCNRHHPRAHAQHGEPLV